MEHYCGYLQAGLRSCTHPWANLNNRLLHKAYLEQIDIYYNLQDDLTITSSTDLKRGEKIIEGCRFPEYIFISWFWHVTMPDPHSILCPPYQASFQPDKLLCSKIACYFAAVINKPASTIEKHLPSSMSTWGKVRIAGSGDSIRAASNKNWEEGRNMSYVQVNL